MRAPAFQSAGMSPQRLTWYITAKLRADGSDWVTTDLTASKSNFRYAPENGLKPGHHAMSERCQ
jgi:hypothetical protein